MQKIVSIALVSAAVLLFQAWIHADPATPQRVTEGFERMFPQAPISSVREAIPGIYEIISQGEVFYTTADGQFLLLGSILDISQAREPQQAIDLTEVTRKRLRVEALAAVGEQRMVSYAPQDYDYTINVFTDVDCTYCRKFHAHMPEFKKMGVRVNYLLTPFRGEAAYARAVGVWCAADRNAAMDRAKAGKNIPLKACDNPVESHLRLSQALGVRGTPAVVLENGTFVRGYQPPQELLKSIEQDAAQPPS